MLNDMTVRNAKAKDRDYKLSDSEGLHFFIAKSGHKSWRFKYRFAGKERRLVFGSYPDVTLAQARGRKAEARKLLKEGRDPGLEAKKQALRNAAAAANTFEAMARVWFGLQEKRWTRGREGRPGARPLLPHGPHDVRDVLATNILKQTGSDERASYAILDTPETVAQHYDRFHPHIRRLWQLRF